MDKAEARMEIDKAEAMIRQARAGTLDINPMGLPEWEQQMRNRIAACINALEKHGSTYVMPKDLLPER